MADQLGVERQGIPVLGGGAGDLVLVRYYGQIRRILVDTVAVAVDPHTVAVVVAGGAARGVAVDDTGLVHARRPVRDGRQDGRIDGRVERGADTRVVPVQPKVAAVLDDRLGDCEGPGRCRVCESLQRRPAVVHAVGPVVRGVRPDVLRVGVGPLGLVVLAVAVSVVVVQPADRAELQVVRLQGINGWGNRQDRREDDSVDTRVVPAVGTVRMVLPDPLARVVGVVTVRVVVIQPADPPL